MPLALPAFYPKVIYDLGANVGISSLFFASLYPKASIYGFEPLPENLEVCLLNYRGIGNQSQVFPWAIGSKTGQATFDCKNDSRGGRLETAHHDPNLRTTLQIQVKIISVADLIEHEGLPAPDFLKIDVEGNELNVLKGAEDYLTRGVISFIQFEFGNAAKAARIYLHDIVFFLESKQYKIFIVKPKGLLPLDFTPFTEMRYSYINLLAVHKNSMSGISDIIITR
jgi:FkbM family methyltransferase